MLPLDVADAVAVERASDEVVKLWGRIDIWVNDAMVGVFAPVHQTTPDEFRRVTEVNYLGYVHGTLAALKHMRHRNMGHIIMVSSALAYRSIPLQSSYCATNAAVRGFTDSLRCELHHEKSGIQVSALRVLPRRSWCGGPSCRARRCWRWRSSPGWRPTRWWRSSSPSSRSWRRSPLTRGWRGWNATGGRAQPASRPPWRPGRCWWPRSCGCSFPPPWPSSSSSSPMRRSCSSG